MLVPSREKKKSPPPPPDGARSVWLVHGNDEFEVANRARALVSSLVPNPDTPDALDIIDGAHTVSDDILSCIGKTIVSLRSGGLFTTEKLVWLRNAQFLPEKRASTFNEVKPRIEALANEIQHGFSPGMKLLISSDRVSKRSQFHKACESYGVVECFDIPDKPWEMEKYALTRVTEWLEEHGIKANSHLAQCILRRAGIDPRLLKIELEKLVTYLGRRKNLTEQDILSIISPGREAEPFELADAVSQRDLPAALTRMAELLHHKMPPVALITGLGHRFRELAIYRVALDNRWLTVSTNGNFSKTTWQDEQGRALSQACLGQRQRASAFGEGRIAEMAKRFSSSELVRAKRDIAAVHASIFRSSLPAELLLELLVIRLVNGSSPRASSPAYASR